MGLTVVSAFTGIGGFDLGFERAGMTVVHQIEKDPACQKVLHRHWPALWVHDDVSKVKGTDLGRADVLCGGFPCQDISVAGRRAGLAGERSGLFHQFMRLVAEVTPDVVVLENVGGLLSSNGGRDMGTVLGVLADLGYGWAYRLLDAQYFGLAQRRRRVFIVGCLGDRSRAAQVLLDPECLSGNPPPGRASREGVAGTLGGGSGDRGWPDDTDRMTFVAGALTGPETETFVPLSVMENERGELRVDDIAGALSTGGGKPGQGYPMAFMWQVGGNSSTADTISYDHTSPVLANSTPAVLASAVRRLTPTECERLQGFPDGWTAGQADAHRYRQLGNAVAVPVAAWIGRRIVETAR